ncbi:MAG: hypothetical protein HQM16_04410 [Deltaproteobacteria bacterium]|nr:hypothetical protein [Deltaproteobacteria bacterium]
MEKEMIEKGYMEFVSIVQDSDLSFNPKELLEIAEKSQIHTFGWPIGVVLHTNEYMPRPYKEGIKCIIKSETMGGSYDYWDLKKNGDFYLLQSFFEDSRTENKIFLDVRISRITEAILHSALLYTLFGFHPDHVVNIRIKHNGLNGRILSIADPMRIMFQKRTSFENAVETDIETKLSDIRTNIYDIVYRAISEMTLMFEYYEPPRNVVNDIAGQFIAQSRSHRDLNNLMNLENI